jgi:hypothetical protein
VIGGQANTASKGRIEDPEGLSEDAGGAIEQTLSALGEQVGGLTIAQLSEKHEAANPPLEISIREDGFEAELRRMIRRPRGKILQEDYDRVGSIDIADNNGATMKDISFVKKLKRLTSITLTDLPLSDLKPLANCNSLSQIRLFNFLKNEVSIQGLESLENLDELRFTGVILNKKPENTFSKMKGIKRLTISGYGFNQKEFLN